MKIKFCGAAEGVTGSCHLITTGTDETPLRILLDCGELQGSKTIDAMNLEPFPFDPADVDFVILSHAHIDHCGRLPLLLKRGFEGKIFCTDATSDLLAVMLRDSAHIHEQEAEWKSRKELRSGRPAVEPLYTMKDAEEVLKRAIPIMYDELVEPVPDVKFVLNDAGHIVGSAIIELWITEGSDVSKLVFSGDLGQHDRPMLEDPT
ncbi:MAG: MBL fold metallo-hydrolase, partial [Clostridiales Family XIII bacterium]|nr:MBL fold metallo-hydrolase [Clostridiales Family XIII bacterium]